MKILVVIPARYHSKRLPGKPLRILAGRPLWEWPYREAQRAKLGEVWVATEEDRVAREVRARGGRVLLTSPRHRCGSDRVWEVSRKKKADIVLNLQGDEPLIQASTLRKLVALLSLHPRVGMSTAATPLESAEELHNPHVVKVVMDRKGFALYFSRSPIPHPGPASTLNHRSPISFWKHLGIYAYRSDFLSRFHRMPPTSLELRENLEQLRVLENGFPILVARVRQESVGVDTPEDLQRAERLLKLHV